MGGADRVGGGTGVGNRGRETVVDVLFDKFVGRGESRGFPVSSVRFERSPEVFDRSFGEVRKRGCKRSGARRIEDLNTRLLSVSFCPVTRATRDIRTCTRRRGGSCV